MIDSKIPTTPDDLLGLLGRTIRSFDFGENFKGEVYGVDLTGERAHFMEGVVLSVDPQTLMITARLTRIVWGGQDASADEVAERSQLRTPLLAGGYGANRIEIGTIQVIA